SVARAVQPPHALVDALLVKHLAGVLAEELDDVKFLSGKGERLSLEGDGSVRVVDGQPAVHAHHGSAGAPGFAPEMRGHPRGQLVDGEGLEHVVIPAAGKAAELVGILHAGGQKQNGTVQMLPQIATYRK